MMQNYLIVAYRNFVRHKVFSFINITGLSIGIAASLLLFQYVSFEFSYDRFHERSPNIYRVILDSYKGGVFQNSSAISYHRAAPAIKDSYPQVINYCRLHRADGMINYYNLTGQVTSYFEPNGLYVDSSFFSIFSFPLVNGNKRTVLRTPNSMLMSESAARKYFGQSDPLGKVITLSTQWEGGDYVVEGVFKDIPENSHFKFDFLFSIEKLLVNKQFLRGGWYWTNFYNYLLLKPGTNVKELESNISSVIYQNLGNDLNKVNEQQKFQLQSLTDIHLHSNVDAELSTNGNIQLIYFILIIALLILAIAWLNYINLSTARALERAKEVGIRKIMGSGRSQLVRQFLFESFLLILIAVAFAALLLIIIKPYFLKLMAKDMMTINLIEERTFWIAIVSFLGLGTFLSGFYPASVLSSFQAIRALRGGGVGNLSADKTRKIMVALQFIASISLIIGTLTIREQIKYMKGQDLGIRIDQKLIIRSPKIIKNDGFLYEMKGFKTLLSQHPTIKSVTSSSEVPGKEIFWTNEFKLKQASDGEKRVSSILAVDEDFISTYGIKLLAGRNFSDQRPADFGGSVIINETEMKALGITTPELALGQEIGDFRTQRIIGVIKDFQQESLKKNSVPIVINFTPWANAFLTVSLNSNNVQADVELVTEAYKKVFPNNAIEYFFLDDFFNRQYKSEEQFWNIFKIFSMLTIFIACIGLFGLSSFIISKRTKEVGIRKALGSSEFGIVILLSKDFLRLIMIAFVLSIPLAWFVMNKWLEGFAHRITIPLWIYGLAGGVAAIIAVLTISIQATKAALENPVKSLRSE